MKKILILEDNPVTRTHLVEILHELDRGNQVFAYDNLMDAYRYALEKEIDLFLVDIIIDKKLPGDTSGLKFVEKIRSIKGYRFVPVIFITCLEDSKFCTYEHLHCYQFIEKPFDVEKLKKTVMECLEYSDRYEEDKTINFRKDGIIMMVEPKNIVYAECINHELQLHTVNEGILRVRYYTLKRLMDQVNMAKFLQCSRSTIISRKFINNIDITNQVIELKDSHGRVDIGATFKKRIKEEFD